MIYKVTKDLKNITEIKEDSFINLNIWERNHIEEWVRKVPSILGEDLLVLSIEFDRFINSSDRLDVLALDKSGNLVVIELKRDLYAGYADLQSLRYAAMVSTMTIEKVLPYYVYYLTNKCGNESANESNSRDNIVNFIKNDEFIDFGNKPRIILVSEDFSPEITTTVLWLRQSNIDISCIKIIPHKIDDDIIIVSNKIIPLQETKQYLVEIKEKEQSQESVKRNRPKTMKILLENEILKEGDLIFLKANLPHYIQFAENDPYFIAKITGKQGQSNAIQWEKDKTEYSISNLTYQIFKEKHPNGAEPSSINGNWHWVNKDGINLWDLAEAVNNDAIA
ncbi:hypothetical protein CH381_23635 [Leptospira sp. mixed culture ATI2-C-A1]|nr:hypothetical protein CH381_23635 [Leptospira sp. mixed culture ATI2-C-A1]